MFDLDSNIDDCHALRCQTLPRFLATYVVFSQELKTVVPMKSIRQSITYLACSSNPIFRMSQGRTYSASSTPTQLQNSPVNHFLNRNLREARTGACWALVTFLYDVWIGSTFTWAAMSRLYIREHSSEPLAESLSLTFHLT